MVAKGLVRGLRFAQRPLTFGDSYSPTTPRILANLVRQNELGLTPEIKNCSPNNSQLPLIPGLPLGPTPFFLGSDRTDCPVWRF